ncbi:hypothetical protein GCM10011363_23520 [Marivita lacus]|uniref:Uncharacterized protein n=1 Tax=Marivita lacus TaxID=1323742 RepID=A0ABQ1KTW4_9RHOB|nr:hypothetical protein GCM10011363_23520 [Marivita lacus]
MIARAGGNIGASLRQTRLGITRNDIGRAQRLEAAKPHAAAFILDVDLPDTGTLREGKAFMKWRNTAGGTARQKVNGAIRVDARKGHIGQRRKHGLRQRGGFFQNIHTRQNASAARPVADQVRH